MGMKTDMLQQRKMSRRKISSLRIIRDPPPESESMTEDVGGIGSSNVPETPEDIEIEGATDGRRRTRGRTTLTDLYNLPPGERVKVSSNSRGQPIGAEAGVMANYRASWHAKFSLEVFDKYLKQTLGKKWRPQEQFEKEIFQK
ncbi:hypothetical protein GQ457_13G027140 [Hibiscus cannabinus]